MSAVHVRDSILGAVGATPMVWLDRLTAGLPAPVSCSGTLSTWPSSRSCCSDRSDCSDWSRC
jgi:hypothetical protein